MLWEWLPFYPVPLSHAFSSPVSVWFSGTALCFVSLWTPSQSACTPVAHRLIPCTAANPIPITFCQIVPTTAAVPMLGTLCLDVLCLFFFHFQDWTNTVHLCSDSFRCLQLVLLCLPSQLAFGSNRLPAHSLPPVYHAMFTLPHQSSVFHLPAISLPR